MTARIGVSIVLYRVVPPDLHRALRGLAAQTHAADRVHVHLNQVADRSPLPALLTQAGLPMPVTVTESADNLGFSGGHNLAVRTLLEAGCDAVMVHNPDLELAPGALALLAEEDLLRHGRALLGPLLLRADEQDGRADGTIDSAGITWTAAARHLDALQGLPAGRAPSATAVVAGLTGACLWVPRDVHEQLVGLCGELFDEDFIAYREDAELAFRAALLGIDSVLVPAATGLHVRGQRGTTRGASALVDRLGVRNRFLIAFKYGRRRPGRLGPALARDALVVAGVLLRERSSLPGLREAWRLRRRMREKGAPVLAAATTNSRQAAGLG